MSSIPAWRLLIKVANLDPDTKAAMLHGHTPAEVADPQAMTAAPVMARNALSARVAPRPAAADPSTSATAAAAGNDTHQHQQTLAADTHTSTSHGASSSRSSCGSIASAAPLVGAPAALDLHLLGTGAASGWCCGCVQVQQQEQSCWIRFNLPPELKADNWVARALKLGCLVSINMDGSDGSSQW